MSTVVWGGRSAGCRLAGLYEPSVRLASCSAELGWTPRRPPATTCPNFRLGKLVPFRPRLIPMRPVGPHNPEKCQPY
jgi:hypothetical protein